jgi:hypothetical protein
MSRRKVWEHTNAEYRAESVALLRELFPPGSEVRTVVKHVSRSGMGRVIDVLAIKPAQNSDAPRIISVGHDVARVLDSRFDFDHDGVWVEGCGMDMCFHLVYTLARALYSDDAETLEKHNRTWRDAGYTLESRPL